MELTKEQVNITKGIAILFMLFLHLFCTKTYKGLFTPIIMIGEVPLVYYLALFGDCCVPIYCFCSGYGLFKSYQRDEYNYIKNNGRRMLRLYINLWVILFLFVILLGPILGRGEQYPGSWMTLVLTATGIEMGYNGAWWFFTTYILLTLLSPFIHKIVKQYHVGVVIGISFLVYFTTYIQRIKGIIVVEDNLLEWMIRQGALLGTTQFAFIVGAIFAQHQYYSKMMNYIEKLKWKNLWGSIIIILMIVGHGIVQSMFIAPFTGLIFILVFNAMGYPKWVDKALTYISKHSTNMWLTHMFFYMIYFKSFVFAPRYPLLIFVWLVLLCIASSCLINLCIEAVNRVGTYTKVKQINI